MSGKNFFILRAFTSSIFIYAGTNHLFHSEKILRKVSQSTAYILLDSPALFSFSVLVSGIAMIAGGIMLTAGYKPRLTALFLLLILVPITLTVQLENLEDLGPFFKNVAIAGSLLFIINYNTNETEKSLVNSSNADN
jgi:putative oxidoreductase